MVAATTSERSSRDRQLILIVDDQSSNRAVLEEILKDEYELCTADNGWRALSICKARLPDLVLLDIHMPGMDGHDVCSQIKNNRRTSGITVIFVTGMASSAEEVRCLESGAVDFLSKPLVPEVVRARVRTHAALKRQTAMLRAFAATDGLTGLSNRRQFDAALETQWRNAAHASEPVSLIMLDVDHFKSYNDAYGHLMGDACLQAIASAMKPFARSTEDVIARYGGEEFVFILPGVEEPQARVIAEDVRAAIVALAIPHVGNEECGGVVTASVGVATLHPHDCSAGPRALIEITDELMFGAKRLGRNRVGQRIGQNRTDAVPSPPIDGSAMDIDAFGVAHRHARSEQLNGVARLAAMLCEAAIVVITIVVRGECLSVGLHGPNPSALYRVISSVPLISVAGIRRGTLDVLDANEHEALTDAQQQQLEKLAGVAIEYVESWQTLQRLKDNW